MIRKVIFRRHGAPRVLEVVTVAEPACGPEEFVVDVAFAGVNYADVLARRGLYKWADAPPRAWGSSSQGPCARSERARAASRSATVSWP